MKQDEQTRQIILASQSSRRKELLEAMGVTFTVLPSDFEERLDHARSPKEVAIELGFGKAMAVARKHPEALVIGSDTIVSLDGKQYGKAASESEERLFLKLLAGKEHEVTTSLVLVCTAQGIRQTTACVSKVKFKEWDETAVRQYIARDEWHDKAVYSVQAGYPLIDYIRGRYDVILGLPTDVLAEWLTKFGVPTKAVTPPCPARIV